MTKLLVMLLVNSMSTAAVLIANLDADDTGADDLVADVLKQLEPLLRKWLANPADPEVRSQLEGVRSAMSA